MYLVIPYGVNGAVLFITMAASVNSMGIMMLIKKDPTTSMAQQSIFLLLGVIVLSVYFFILKNRIKEVKI